MTAVRAAASLMPIIKPSWSSCDSLEILVRSRTKDLPIASRRGGHRDAAAVNGGD